jgi:serine/threonine protein kinase
LDRLQTLHSKKILHRDVKPDNYVIGLEDKSNIVYLIDYGLVKRYTNSVTNEHISFSDQRRMVGTPRYCILNGHKGCEQSRRDDLESLGYCLIYMLRGSLPWQGIREDTKEERNLKIKNLKEKITLNELCKGLPKEVLQYMYSCRNLGFDEKPPYSELHSLLSKVFVRNTCLKNFQYDWLTKKCKAPKGKRKDTEDSNKAEYEGVQRKPKRNISRRLKIQNLVSKNSLGSAVLKEEEKMPDKSRTLEAKPEKKVVLPTINSSNTIQEFVTKAEVKRIGLIKEAPTNLDNMKKIGKSKVSEECDFDSVEIAERMRETGRSND